MVALSSTETSPDVSGILGIEKEETRGKIVLGELPNFYTHATCDMEISGMSSGGVCRVQSLSRIAD